MNNNKSNNAAGLSLWVQHAPARPERSPPPSPSPGSWGTVALYIYPHGPENQPEKKTNGFPFLGVLGAEIVGD